MTDAITAAFADLDTAISGIVGELSTLSQQVKQLEAGNVNDALVAEIKQRTEAITAATQSVQAALSTTANGTPTSPITTVGTGGTTDIPVTVSTEPSTPVDDSDVVNPNMAEAPADGTNSGQGAGSAMG
jgi:hypothetical protein